MRPSEIEATLKGRGDYVKIDELARLLTQNLATDTKKFVTIELAKIYESRGMHVNAAKLFDNLAISSSTYADQIMYFTKEAELFIKGSSYPEADMAMKKAIAAAAPKERDKIVAQIKTAFFAHAQEHEKNRRRNNALRAYEKILELELTETERTQVKQKLLPLYESLGKVREYLNLKQSLK